MDLAEREDILLLEDSPYAFFHAGTPRLPTLKALDRSRRVVYFGSFSKTAYAGAHIGYVVADQPVTRDGSGAVLFADQLARLKSMLTLNTSTVAQAAIGGFLVENGCKWNAPPDGIANDDGTGACRPGDWSATRTTSSSWSTARRSTSKSFANR